MEKNSKVLKIGIVLQPYTGHASGQELSPGPAIIYEGLGKILKEMDVKEGTKELVKITKEEEKDYGLWHRLGLADGHLGRIVARIRKEGRFPLGLLANCNSSLGMLAGLQHSGPTNRKLKVGLIWFDTHADFNTPETSLSGMLGGMPVAIAAGQCLFRLRFKAGLDPAISTKNIVMMGVRDIDPLEAELIDNSNITMITTDEMVTLSKQMRNALDRLSEHVDIIYIHIDLDVLEPSDIPGVGLPVPKGPTAAQLAAVLELIMTNKKIGALGIASFPIDEEGRTRSLQAALKVIEGALSGIKAR